MLAESSTDLVMTAAGSVRAPATCNGLLSMRLSFNSTSIEGMAVNSKYVDASFIVSKRWLY
jgi:Asp-tRNA(Asn)/Glu-tRNA(Gln) amidotransferase A subunit family amidase